MSTTNAIGGTSTSSARMIRPAIAEDVKHIKEIISKNELFPSEMIDGMIHDYLQDQQKQQQPNNPCDELWFVEENTAITAITDESDDQQQSLGTTTVATVSGVVFCGPEKMTEGTYNAFLLAVHPSYQGQGCGTRLMNHLEQYLVSPPANNNQAHLLLVETSGTPEFERQRMFYERKLGYEQEARIRDFYQPGEDKIVYRKLLKK